MKFPPTEKQLLHILHESGVPVPDKKLSLQEQSLNHERRDYTERRNYVLYAGPDIIGFLTAGRNLHLLAKRIELFHRAYPSFGTRILGYSKAPAGELLLQEHFAGKPANVFLGQPAGVEKIRIVLEKIFQAFDHAQHTSTPDAAKVELHAFLAQVSALSYWTPVDKTFLLEVVGPYLQKHLLTGARWTHRVSNGDFLLRNLLINSAGEFRIIDCEFAADTHFHEEDWLRFAYWDALPQALRALVEPRTLLRNPWTVFFGLKQLLLESSTKIPQKALEAASHWCREIRQIVEYGENTSPLSSFWPSSGQTAAQISTEVRLYWLTDQGWSDRDSVSIFIDAGRPVQVVFEIPAEAIVHALRLDPMNTPGVVTVHSLKVVLPDNADQVLWAGEDPITLQHLVAGGDSLLDIDPTSGAFRVISLDNDPQLFLNGVGKTVGQSLQVRLIVTFSTDPLDQIGPIRRYVQALLKQNKKSRDTSESIDSRLSLVIAQLGSFSETTKVSLAKIAEDGSTKIQLESFDAHLAVLAGQLGAFAETTKVSLAKIADDGSTKTQLESLDANLAVLAGQLGAFAEATKVGLAKIADDGSTKTQLESVDAHLATLSERFETRLTVESRQREELEQELRGTRKSLLLLQATLPERERQLNLAREALQGHARTIDRLEQSRDKLDQALQISQASVVTQMEAIRASEDGNGRLAQELAATRERVAILTEQTQRLEINCGSLQSELIATNSSLESSRLKESQATARTEATLDELGRASASLVNHEKLLLELGEQLASTASETRTAAANFSREKQLRLEMENSRSWRWTAWIRHLDSKCRRFFNNK